MQTNTDLSFDSRVAAAVRAAVDEAMAAYTASQAAFQQAVLSSLRHVSDTLQTLRLEDDAIAQAAMRYESKMAVVKGAK